MAVKDGSQISTMDFGSWRGPGTDRTTSCFFSSLLDHFRGLIRRRCERQSRSVFVTLRQVFALGSAPAWASAFGVISSGEGSRQFIGAFHRELDGGSCSLPCSKMGTDHPSCSRQGAGVPINHRTFKLSETSAVMCDSCSLCQSSHMPPHKTMVICGARVTPRV